MQTKCIIHLHTVFGPFHKYSDRVSACDKLEWPAKLQMFAIWSLTEVCQPLVQSRTEGEARQEETLS